MRRIAATLRIATSGYFPGKIWETVTRLALQGCNTLIQAVRGVDD